MPPLTEHVFAPAQRHCHQCFFSAQTALIVETFTAVADAGYQYPVNPAFEGRRRREPVNWKIENQANEI